MSFDKSSGFRELAGALESCRLQSRIRQTRLLRYNVALCCEYFIWAFISKVLYQGRKAGLLDRVELGGSVYITDGGEVEGGTWT